MGKVRMVIGTNYLKEIFGVTGLNILRMQYNFGLDALEFVVESDKLPESPEGFELVCAMPIYKRINGAARLYGLDVNGKKMTVSSLTPTDTHFCKMCGEVFVPAKPNMLYCGRKGCSKQAYYYHKKKEEGSK